MRILILNWRCPRHPKAGGAEFLTFELAKRFVRAGDSVEWFSASYAGAAKDESIDGVQFKRSGHQATVHIEAYRTYRKIVRDRFDAVIDEINTVPFFGPLWAGIPTFGLIFQLAREVWWYETSFPLNALGYLLEPLYLRIYRDTPMFTISTSTARDLRHLGFRGGIEIIPIGIEPVLCDSAGPSAVPSFVYVGRLAPSKRVSDIIQAFGQLRKLIGRGHLRLVGEGRPGHVNGLRRLAERLELNGSVEFCGRLETAEKYRVMAASHALVMASVREGWGLVITEANACGTPAIVYDVPGLRDAVTDEQTGLVVSPTPGALSQAMYRIIMEDGLRDRLASGARVASGAYSLDRSAAVARSVIEKHCARLPLSLGPQVDGATDGS